MAYYDPYNEHSYGRQQNHYGEPESSPYANNRQPYATYEQEGQTHDSYAVGDYSGAHRSKESQANLSNGFERGEFSPTTREKSTSSLRRYRDEYRGNLWTQGGRGRCLGRFLCCTIMIAVFLILSIVLALALWIRPPSVVIGSAELDQSGTGVQVQDTGIVVPLEVNITVANPNYFSVNLKHLKVELSYPLNNNSTSIGQGEKSDVVFASHSNSSLTFPFNFDYEFANDPNFAILLDIANKCGLGGTKSDLKISYKISIGLRILIVSISPSVSNTFSISCPFSDSQLQELLDKFNLGSLIGSST
ncbi:hypothetical protein K435DRAFT_969976 [Dendrothele bispora CBS 962.96]|uniref:Late embryogenesis abundant protein LEA-2 subgroup domain-containing protein n=1 Tax=Dendrothele bispora (strain CBS 962.96) TaxID=1314807 RepID=A0A4S8LEA1_DENBC|nr:hypothetical protein K435DRAFT_969976 [Dendrothele bispora CBS 962.96]